MSSGVNAFAENDWLEIRRTDDVFEPLPDGLCFQLVAGSNNISKDHGKCYEINGGVEYRINVPSNGNWSDWQIVACWNGLCSAKSLVKVQRSDDSEQL